MGCLAVGEARGWPAQGVKAGSQPSRPRPQVHAAEFCQHEAESRAEPEQRSGQDIISAGRARARGWMGGKGWEVGGGGSSHPTASLAATSPPAAVIPHPSFSSPQP